MIIKKLCKVCGCRFEVKKENVYLAREPKAANDILTKPQYIFDVIDCPHCGCQVSLNIRMPRYDNEQE